MARDEEEGSPDEELGGTSQLETLEDEGTETGAEDEEDSSATDEYGTTPSSSLLGRSKPESRAKSQATTSQKNEESASNCFILNPP
jgi:hypothetical protein